MKLSPEIMTILTNSCAVARSLGITEIAIEDTGSENIIRGMADKGTPVLILDQIKDELDFRDLAIRDTTMFLNRVQLATHSDEDHKVTINVDSSSQSVSGFNFKGKKFKMNFATGSSKAIRSPKKLNDVTVVKFVMNPETVDTINKATSAVVGEDMTLVSDGLQVSFEVKTSTKDTFTYTITDELEKVDGDNGEFVFSYPVKTLLLLVKNSDTKQFGIGKRGILNTTINHINVYLLPKV